MRLTKSTALVASVITALTMSACSPMRAELVDDGIISKSNDTVIEDNLSCVVDAADYNLYTDVLAFEVTSNTGVGFGFNFASGLLRAIGVNLKSAKARLDMAMHLYEGLKPATALVDTTGSANSSTINFGLDFSLALLRADLAYYYKTPVATLSNNALASTLNAVKTKAATVQSSWSTRVYKVVDESQFLVHVGKKANLRVGDQFNIYDTVYEWTGESCASTLLMARKVSTTPVAVAVVTQLDADSAVMEVTNSVATVKRGDLVQISKLPLKSGEASRTLARSVHLAAPAGGKIPFDNNGLTETVDISPFVDQQLKALISNYGMYAR